MPAFRGNNWRIGLGHEVTEGTLVAPTQHYRFLQGSNVTPKDKVAEEYEGDGTIDISFVNKDSQLWTGKIDFYPRSTDIGFILQAIMGTGSETVKVTPTGATIATAATGGTVAAGIYFYTYAYLYGQVAGPAQAPLTVTTTGATSTVTISGIPADTDATGIRMYKGVAGGLSGVYTQSGDVAYGTTALDTGSVPVFTAFATGVTANATGGGLHLFKPQSALDFYTFEYGQPLGIANQIMARIADCMITELTLDASPGRPVKASISFVGKYAQQQASLAAAVFDAGTPLHTSNSTFIVDGTTSLWVEKFKFTYKLNVNEGLIFTHNYPETFLLERRKVTVDYDLLFQDSTTFNKFISGGVTTTPVAGTTIDSATVATGSMDLRFGANSGTDQTNTLGITIANLSYACKPVVPNLDGKPFLQPVSGFGTRSASNLLTAQLRNSRITAY